MHSRSMLAAALLALGAPVPLFAQAPPPSPQASLAMVEAPCLGTSCVGMDVAVGEDAVYFAAPFSITRPGIVYAYARSAAGWTEAARITADDAVVGVRFGTTIAASGSMLVAARLPDAEGRGTVFAFERRRDAWNLTARLRPSDAAANDSAGFALALEGDLLAVGAPGASAKAGAVYLFRRGGDDRWSEEAKLTASDGQPGDAFGRAVALSGDSLIVGAPLRANGRGGAYLFVRESGVWREEPPLRVINGAQDGDLLGARVEFWREWIVLTAPGYSGRIGAAFLFSKIPNEPSWFIRRRLLPYDGRPFGLFGTALAPVGDELWIGAPFVFTGSSFPPTPTGAVYRFAFDPRSGDWTGARKLVYPGAVTGLRVGSALAVAGNTAAVGLPGKDNEMGGVVVFGRDQAGEWRVESELIAEPEMFARVTGNSLTCAGGQAAAFECGNMELLSFLPLPEIGGKRGIQLSGMWGWTDPQNGREYALVGRMDGTSFVDVTDPSNPTYLGDLPLTEGATPSSWREIKVYRDHAFIVSDGAGAHGMQIFDLAQLRNVRGAPVTFTATARYDRIFSAHNIVINEDTGFAFATGSGMGGETCGGGLHMIDIRDPRSPTFAGCFSDPQTGMAGTGYSHDAQCVIYRGPDERYRGREICLGSNETMLSIADVTDKAAPVAIARASYPNVQYSHQGWLTDDHRYFYMNDEGDELAGVVARTRTIIWDVSELDDPIVAGEYLGETSATDHNLYIRGDLMYESNYVSGLRVIDISDRLNPVEIGFFDSVPNSENTPGFSGSWSNYPFFPSGTVVFTSMREGLFVVRPRRPVS